MEISNNILCILELMERPAFIATNGHIHYVNSHGRQLGLTSGASLSELLQKHSDQCENISHESITLSITVEAKQYTATAQKLDGFDLFLLEVEEDRMRLQTLAMVAQQLRLPLSSLLNALEEENADPQAVRAARQLHRAVSNMSDAARYRSYRSPELTVHELRGFMASVIEAITAHTASVGIQVSYNGPSTELYCLIDQELLERAILNLVSNSIKAHSTQIEISVSRKRNTLYLCVKDNGSGVPSQLRGQMYTRFQREPGLYENSYGLGLGMVIVQAAAAAHNGTVLIEHPQAGGLRVTLALSIMEGESMVQSPPFRFDYLGGMDHTLTELSDVLPESEYQNRL